MPGFRDHGPPLHPRSADPLATEPDGSLPIMLVHLPRTAGTTVKRTLESIFGAERSLLDLHFFATTDEDLSRFAVIEGHKRAAFFLRTFGPRWSANGVTIIREPVARVVSQARHIRALPHHRDHAHLVEEVDDPVGLFDQVPMLSNLQTKLLAGRSPRAEQVDAGDLEAAKGVLAEIAFGLTNSFDASMCLLAERFGLVLPRYGVSAASARTGDADLRTRRFRTEAAARNDFDRALYEYASTVFDERVGRYVASLLDLPLDESRLEFAVRSAAGGTGTVVARHPRSPSAHLRGWALIDGRPPDAVLVRTPEQVTPVCGRIASYGAVRRTRSVADRNAGFVGRVALPTGASSLELIAFDRARGLRAHATVAVEEDVHADEDAETAPARETGSAPPAATAEPASVR